MSYEQIRYGALRGLLYDRATQLVEVLPPGEYAGLHLPRALSIPLKTLDEQTAAALDMGRLVVVYCSEDCET